MAKATHAQEVSTGTSDSYTEHELSDPTPTRAMLGVLIERGETSSQPQDGTPSMQSSESEPTSNEKPNQSLQQPAQTTESHSEQKAQEPVPGSSAHLMDGDGQKTHSQPSGRKAAPVKKAQPAKKTGARATALDAEDDFDELD